MGGETRDGGSIGLVGFWPPETEISEKESGIDRRNVRSSFSHDPAVF